MEALHACKNKIRALEAEVKRLQGEMLKQHKGQVHIIKQRRAEVERLQDIVSFYENLVDDEESADWPHGDVRHREHLGKRLAEIDRLQDDIAALRFMLDLEWKAKNGDTPSPNWVPYARALQEADAAEKMAASS